MLTVAMNAQRLEACLAAGQVACPGCGGPLAPWGFARSREVRLLDGVRSVRPRRASCQRCAATHVLCPAWIVPRRRDGAEVIGAALHQATTGAGHRAIARRLHRPDATVRGWLRAGRRRSESLRDCGSRWAYALDPELGPVTPAGSPLGDAIEILSIAARAWVLRFGRDGASPWERIVSLTGGLLYGQPPLPP